MEWRFVPPGDPVADSVAVFQGREHVPHLDRAFHRPRLERTAALVTRLIEKRGAQSVTDLGCGDGGLLSLLPSSVPAWGYDIREASVAAARPGCDVRFADITDVGSLELGEVVVCTETLEHLDDPVGLVTALKSAGAKWLVASSPRKERPGKRLEMLHVWGWDDAGYRAMLERGGWHTVHQEGKGTFQIVVAR